MFFYLAKALWFVLQPSTLIALLIGYGAILIWTGWARWGRPGRQRPGTRAGFPVASLTWPLQHAGQKALDLREPPRDQRATRSLSGPLS